MNVVVLSTLLSICMLIQGIEEHLDLRGSSRAILHIIQQYAFYMAGVSTVITAAFLSKIPTAGGKTRPIRCRAVEEEPGWFGCLMLTVIIPYFYMAPLPFIDNYLVR